MREDVAYAKVRIGPVDCLLQGARLIADQFWLFVGIGAMYVLATQVPMGILLGPIAVGSVFCLHDRRRGERVPFQRLFDGFQHFLEALIASVIIVGILTLISIAAAIPFTVVAPLVAHASEQGGNPLPFMALVGFGILAVLLLVSLVNTFFVFVYPLIALKGMRGLEAIPVSIAAARKNFFGILMLQFLALVLQCLAAMMCLVPLFAVIPVVLAAGYVAYCKVFEGEERIA